ncbi:MAG: sigma-70 family RNA polymerase sigma factor [Deltaproteobacteria bacterium]|nr:sigma-70 family RNA polymerase sigma factor [Deltaproteobacteria bacterium]
MSDDAPRIRAWQQGNDEAGSAVVRALFPRVVRFFRGKVPDHEVQDLTQQTFVELTGSLPNVDPERDLAPWVFTIARRQLMRRHRHQQRHPEAPLLVSAAAPGATPSKVVRTREIKEILADALGRLSLDQRLCLELRYWEKLSIEGIAQVLEVNGSAAKMRLLRARQALRAQLEGLGLSATLAVTTLAELTGSSDD